MSDTDMMTAEERDRQFEARRGAALAARDVLWGIEEPDAEDIVVIGEWLLTGTADLALQFNRERALNFPSTATGSPDAASWNAAVDGGWPR